MIRKKIECAAFNEFNSFLDQIFYVRDYEQLIYIYRNLLFSEVNSQKSKSKISWNLFEFKLGIFQNLKEIYRKVPHLSGIEKMNRTELKLQLVKVGWVRRLIGYWDYMINIVLSQNRLINPMPSLMRITTSCRKNIQSKFNVSKTKT
jgi:hypothetical protein